MPKRKDIPEETASSEIPDKPSATSAPTPEGKAFEIPYLDKAIPCKRFSSSNQPPSLIFTHGAGGTLNAAAMVNFAAGFTLSKSLLYFQGSMNLKARTKLFHTVSAHEDWSQFLGGRSMGARAAVMAAHENQDVIALVLVSYPLKNEKGDIRDQILLDLKEGVDVLFISGNGDSMCDFNDLKKVRQKMKAKSWLAVVNGADHGMNVKPKKATDPIGRMTGEVAAEWLDTRNLTETELAIWWDNENTTACKGTWGAETDSPSSSGKATKKEASKITAKGPSKKLAKKLDKNSSKNDSKIEDQRKPETELSSTKSTRETRSRKRKRAGEVL
jgi:predicted alpha/beta-hydrolase family hydrolase